MTEYKGAEFRVASSDVKAFGNLVLQYQSMLRAFLRRLTRGDHSRADDLAQETFLKAHQKMAQFQGGSLQSWLFAIAWSNFLMDARRRNLESIDDVELEDDNVLSEGSIIIRLDLERAFTYLKPVERAALTLCFAVGMPHEEAAIALNLPLGTLKSHVARGREKLKTLLVGYAP